MLSKAFAVLQGSYGGLQGLQLELSVAVAKLGAYAPNQVQPHFLNKPLKRQNVKGVGFWEEGQRDPLKTPPSPVLFEVLN